MAKNGGGKGKGKKGGKGKDKAQTTKGLIRDLMGSGLVAGLSGPKARKEINAAARVRYGPLQNEYEAQLRATKLQTKRDKGYFDQYEKALRALRGETTDVYSGAQAALAQAQAQTNSQDSGILAALNQGRQADASLLGAAPSQAANPLAAAQATRSSDALGNRSRVIGQGASQEAYGIDQQRIAKRAKIDQVIKGRAQANSIRQEIEDLAREKGAFKSDARRDYRDAERGFLVDMLNSAEGRRAMKLQAKLDSKAAKQEARLEGKSDSSSSGGGKGGGKRGKDTDAQDQKQKNKEEARDARALLKGSTFKRGTDVKKIIRFLVGQDIDPSVARRVAKAWAKGGGGKGGRGGGGRTPGDGLPPF